MFYRKFTITSKRLFQSSRVFWKKEDGVLGNGMEGINRIAVVGAGQMGCGIAQVAAQNANLSVIILDSNKAQLEKCAKFIGILLDKDIVKGKINEAEKKNILARITATDNIKHLDNVDFCIEAVSENPALKKELFVALDTVLAPHAILATNTSSISITKIASATKRPHQVFTLLSTLISDYYEGYWHAFYESSACDKTG